MIAPIRIESPHSKQLEELCQQLAALSREKQDAWPAAQLALCGQYGVFQWFLPVDCGGQGWCEADLVRGYLAISQACLTTAFVITQRTAACKRLESSPNSWLRSELLPDLASGRSLATVAISHLTTSRQHLRKPVLTATRDGDDFVLNGFSPWVTGADQADHVVAGATLSDGMQLLAAIPSDMSGVSTPPPHQLVGLSGSHTGPMILEQVRVGPKWIVDGPVDDIMGRRIGGSTGGLQTSTLAVGLASAAVDYLKAENTRRDDLREVTNSLGDELNSVRQDLLEMATGESDCSKEEIRIRANSLVLRATQAALTAAKGTGYVADHVAGRWCREALFFLVWSCPQAVVAANLCELAGISDD